MAWGGVCTGCAAGLKLSWVFAMEKAGLTLNIGAEVQGTGSAHHGTTEIISPHLTGASNAVETLQEGATKAGPGHVPWAKSGA